MEHNLANFISLDLMDPNHTDLNTPIGKAIKYITENIEEKITLDDLSSVSGYSKFHFCRYFNSKLNMTPMKWIPRYRATLAFLQIISQPYPSMTTIALACGFCTPSHLSYLFRKEFGISPTMAYQRYNSPSEVSEETMIKAAISIASAADFPASMYGVCQDIKSSLAQVKPASN